MITNDYVCVMARYNQWQNGSLIAAADTLDEQSRNQDRGAFFGSIRGTMSHLLWGDQIWMHRFCGSPKPAAPSIVTSADMPRDWGEFKQSRVETDETIIAWSKRVSPAWLDSHMTWYSGAAQREISKPASFLVMHFFNHQTHHRGQVHAMLTAAGAAPDDTDLFYLDM